MIKIICNRCNKPIESMQKVGFIQFCYQNPFENSAADDNILDRNHFCADCMAEIERFIRNDNVDQELSVVHGIQKGLKTPTDSVVEQVKKIAENITESMNPKENDAPLLREKDFKSEPRTSRYRIDYARIMSLKESGMKNKDIAVEMGMTSQEVATAVYTYKKRNGVESERKESSPKKTKPKKSEEPQEQEKKVDVGKIKALWNAKWSISKIADEMDMAESEIIDVLDQR